MGVADEEPATMTTAAQIVMSHLGDITTLLPFKLSTDKWRTTYRDMTHFGDRAACTCLLIECL